MPPDGSEPPESPSRGLDVLTSVYPLAPGWRPPEVFMEEVEIAGVRLYLVGLFASGEGGREVTGSAASADSTPLERAYFELLERASLADALARPRARYSVFDEHGRQVGACEHADVFPVNEPGASFRYALSNGVAAGSSFQRASRAAFLELVERDRILRSWYGEVLPVRVVTPRLGALERLSAVYRLETFEFPSAHAGRDTGHVAAVFGFPPSPEAPFIRGMGAGASRGEAEGRAAAECLQTLGFLWGEAIPANEPEPSATAEYHQEYYLWPQSQPRIDQWLQGQRHRRDICLSHGAPRRSSPRFADLTPPHLFGRVRIVKALPEGELPVVFGLGHPSITGSAPFDLGVHPVS